MDTVKLVTFGRGGDTAYCGAGPERALPGGGSWREGRSTISGYGRPDRPHAGCPTDSRDIPDGTPALDLLPALDSADGWAWAIKGPMVDVDLQDGDFAACPEPSGIFAAAVSGNQFGAMLAVHAATKGAGARGSLDSVSIAEYVREWVARGARLGHYCGGRIVWGD